MNCIQSTTKKDLNRKAFSVMGQCLQHARRTSMQYLLLAVFSLCLTQQAHASCVSPEYELVWSYPKDGEQNVPTNAMIWILPSIYPASATINGVPLTRGALPYSWTFDLQPNTAYEILVTSFVDQKDTLSLSFTTGAEPPSEPPLESPIVTSIEATKERDLSEQCRAVLWAQECYDTGQDTHVIFNVQSNSLAWIVEDIYGRSLYWPSICGAPEVFTWIGPGLAEQPCYYLTAVDRFGGQARSGPHCLESTAETDVLDTADTAQADTSEQSNNTHADTNADMTANEGQIQSNSHQEEPSGGCQVGRMSRVRIFPWVLGITLLWWGLRRRKK